MSSFSTPSDEQILPKKKKGRKPKNSQTEPLDSLLPFLSDQSGEQSNSGQASTSDNNTPTKKRGRKPKAKDLDSVMQSNAEMPALNGISTGNGIPRRAKSVPKKRGRKPKKMVRMPKIKFLVGGTKVDPDIPMNISDEKLLPKKRGRKPNTLKQDETMPSSDTPCQIKSENRMDSPSDLGIANALDIPSRSVLKFDPENPLKFDPENQLKFDPENPMKIPSESLLDLFQNENLQEMFQLENPMVLEMLTNHGDIQNDISMRAQSQIPHMTQMGDVGDIPQLPGTEESQNRRGHNPKSKRKVSNVGQKRKGENQRAHLPKRIRLGDFQNIRKSPRQTKTKVFLDHVTF